MYLCNCQIQINHLCVCVCTCSICIQVHIMYVCAYTCIPDWSPFVLPAYMHMCIFLPVSVIAAQKHTFLRRYDIVKHACLLCALRVPACECVCSSLLEAWHIYTSFLIPCPWHLVSDRHLHHPAHPLRLRSLPPLLSLSKHTTVTSPGHQSHPVTRYPIWQTVFDIGYIFHILFIHSQYSNCVMVWLALIST